MMYKQLYFRRFLGDMGGDNAARSLGVIALMTGASIFEGVALTILFPLLSILGFSGSDFDGVTNKIIDLLGHLALPLNVFAIAALFVCLILLQHAFYLSHTWIAAGLQARATANWRRQLTDALLNCEWLYFARQNPGELSHILNFETGRASHLVNYASQIASFCLTAAVYILVAFVASWKVTLALMVGGAIIVIVSHLLVKRPALLSGRQTEVHTRYAGKSAEVLGGMKLIRAMNGNESVHAALWPRIAELQQVERKVIMNPALLRSSFEVSAIVALMVVLVFAVKMADTDGVTVLLIAALFLRLYPRISAVQQYVQQFRMAIPYYAAVVDALDDAWAAAEARSPQAGAPGPLPAPPEIRLREVTVRYGERSALRDVDFHIAARQTVAVIGASGAGKSTLVDALLRLVPLQGGEIEINGENLSKIDLGVWRRSVGYVPQDTFLFNATIRENIAFAQPHLSFDKVKKAAQQAQLLEFVESLPDGFETVVGDRGIMLSGGQRQRIGIARALAGGKSMLIFDEATSALDSETEAAVMADIAKLRGEMTIIIIAHRLSALKIANKIFVLDDGRLVESGDWDSLIAFEGTFRKLWNMQTAFPVARPAAS
jgi:ABC-type multidrug transport system fused ATPase/permease subunit